jgi:hypothetical protein
MAIYTTEQQYLDAITETQTALQRVRLIGKETENDSGGSKRRMIDTELKDLTEHLQLLQRELAFFNGTTGAIVLGCRW